MKTYKLGNPHRTPRRKRQRTIPFAPSPIKRPRLTLHESDPITGSDETLYSLSYEYYRGYTIYSTPEGRCCIHGRQGCMKLRGQFVCLPDIEEAKTLIKRLRAEGYAAVDSVERNLPEGEFVGLNRHEQQRMPMLLRSMQHVS